MAFKRMSWKEKRKHYTDVASGVVPVKSGSKFTESEQRAYARGQRDARNEAARNYAYKNATPLQREVHKKIRAERRIAFLQKKGGN